MDINEFYYDLPERYIAKKPLQKRDSSKLLVLNKRGEIFHDCFSNIINYFSPGDVLVLNDTKVIKARVEGRKKTGGLLEMLFFKDFMENRIYCLVKGRIKDKATVFVDNIEIELTRISEGLFEADFLNAGLEYVLERYGKMPIPPYLKRESDKEDETAYQTVIAEKEGAVASPTAALHFTEELLKKLRDKGVIITYITLHTGPGTFLPIKTDKVEEHKMLPEYFEISEETADLINKAEKDKRKIFYCGTTVVRAIEDATDDRGILLPTVGKTNLYIYPGYRFKKVKNMITNFHLPASTPLLLVSALIGKDYIFKAYEEAKRNDYRFFSYGDGMLILKD